MDGHGRGRHNGGGRGKGNRNGGASGGRSSRGGRGGGGGGGGGGRGWSGRASPSMAFSMSNATTTQFVMRGLVRCPAHRLPEVVGASMALWTTAWHQAAELDGVTLKTLLSALARLPVSATLPPPHLEHVVAGVLALLREPSAIVSDPHRPLHEAKLEAVEVVEKVVQRLLKFCWDRERVDVSEALLQLLTTADGMLEMRHATHRKARERVMLLFVELERPWAVKTTRQGRRGEQDTATTTTTTAATGDAGDVGRNAGPAWTHPTVAWLADWNNFQPLKLPQMKVPGGRGDGVYESADEYFDTVLRVWTGMTFVDGNNALLPHCPIRTGDKICDQPLWPIQRHGAVDYACRTSGCARLVEFICPNRHHDRGYCRLCAQDRQQRLRGPPSPHASTHIYDASVVNLQVDGVLYLKDVASRRPPERQIHWKTTRRLSSPNLVGVVVVAGRGASLRLTDEIYWAKVTFHGNSRDEWQAREGGRLALELLEYTVDETGNPLLSQNVENGAAVAVIDCQTFVPEFIPVLKALQRQSEMPTPFQGGSLVNLQRREVREGSNCRVHLTDVERDDDSSQDVEPTATLLGNVSTTSTEDVSTSWIRRLVDRVVEESLLDPIVQIRRDTDACRSLKVQLSSLIASATMDPGQLESFVAALRHPVHCTQGPPGTGKSYLGVVIVRALLIVRTLWIRVAPSVGQPPILVLSYKNHAIDEFLVDLVRADPSLSGAYFNPLIRLGGGCTEPKLFRYQESIAIEHSASVKTLTSALDGLHDTAKAIQAFRHKFGSVYEAQTLIGSNDVAEWTGMRSLPPENRRKLIEASHALNVIAATVLKLTSSFAEEGSDDAGKLAQDGVELVNNGVELAEVVRECVINEQLLTYDDVPLLYGGIRHYDPHVDPSEIMLKWMCGVIPLSCCQYPHSKCVDIVKDEASLYCAKHCCDAVDIDDAFCCREAAIPDRQYCLDHLCTSSGCVLPRLPARQLYCMVHACSVCLRIGAVADCAEDDPPRIRARSIHCVGQHLVVSAAPMWLTKVLPTVVITRVQLVKVGQRRVPSARPWLFLEESRTATNINVNWQQLQRKLKKGHRLCTIILASGSAAGQLRSGSLASHEHHLEVPFVVTTGSNRQDLNN